MTDICPECHKANVVMDTYTGEEVCKDCGYVVSRTMMSHEQEWGSFTVEEYAARTRASPMPGFSREPGMGTRIGLEYENRDYSGARLSEKKLFNFQRLRRQSSRFDQQGEYLRTERYATDVILMLAGKLTLPRFVVEEAVLLFRRAKKGEVTKGRTLYEVIGACLYIACKMTQFPRTLKDISVATQVHKKSLFDTYGTICRRLSIGMHRMESEIYLPRAFSLLKLTGETEIVSMKILNVLSSNKMMIGKSPISVASAVVWIATRVTDDSRTQGEVAKAFNTTEVTIRNRYKDTLKKVAIEVKV